MEDTLVKQSIRRFDNSTVHQFKFLARSKHAPVIEGRVIVKSGIKHVVKAHNRYRQFEFEMSAFVSLRKIGNS